jgi:antitoxin Phd
MIIDRQEWSLQDAKNGFSAVVEAACRGTSQTVTKCGKPAVVVLSVTDCEKLAREAAQHRHSFVEHLLAFLQGEGRFNIPRA